MSFNHHQNNHNSQQNNVRAGWLLKSSPTKGIFRKQLGKWRKQWFVLKKLLTPGGQIIPGQSGYVLEYYLDESCQKLKGIIDLNQYEQVNVGLSMEIRTQNDDEAYEHIFEVRTKKRTFYLAASSSEEMIQWVDAICSACGLSTSTLNPDGRELNEGENGLSSGAQPSLSNPSGSTAPASVRALPTPPLPPRPFLSSPSSCSSPPSLASSFSALNLSFTSPQPPVFHFNFNSFNSGSKQSSFSSTPLSSLPFSPSSSLILPSTEAETVLANLLKTEQHSHSPSPPLPPRPPPLPSMNADALQSSNYTLIADCYSGYAKRETSSGSGSGRNSGGSSSTGNPNCPLTPPPRPPKPKAMQVGGPGHRSQSSLATLWPAVAADNIRKSTEDRPPRPPKQRAAICSKSLATKNGGSAGGRSHATAMPTATKSGGGHCYLKNRGGGKGSSGLRSFSLPPANSRHHHHHHHNELCNANLVVAPNETAFTVPLPPPPVVDRSIKPHRRSATDRISSISSSDLTSSPIGSQETRHTLRKPPLPQSCPTQGPENGQKSGLHTSHSGGGGSGYHQLYDHNNNSSSRSPHLNPISSPSHRQHQQLQSKLTPVANSSYHCTKNNRNIVSPQKSSVPTYIKLDQEALNRPKSSITNSHRCPPKESGGTFTTSLSGEEGGHTSCPSELTGSQSVVHSTTSNNNNTEKTVSASSSSSSSILANRVIGKNITNTNTSKTIYKQVDFVKTAALNKVRVKRASMKGNAT